MPSEEYYHLSDDDLGALIGYLKQLEPVDRELPGNKVGPVARLLLTLDKIPVLVSAEQIDYSVPRSKAPQMGETVEYGEYLAKTCMGCHGADYRGGKIAGGDPSWPAATNLTPHKDGIGDWDKTDFLLALRKGIGPDGREVDPAMPWKQFSQMTDAEIEALWLFFNSLEAEPGR